jgi:hypothetical protein
MRHTAFTPRRLAEFDSENHIEDTSRNTLAATQRRSAENPNAKEGRSARRAHGVRQRISHEGAHEAACAYVTPTVIPLSVLNLCGLPGIHHNYVSQPECIISVLLCGLCVSARNLSCSWSSLAPFARDIPQSGFTHHKGRTGTNHGRNSRRDAETQRGI